MLSDTLARGLEQYGIGEKLRRLRLRRKIGLVALASHTGLSPALLSKLERGKMVPTLPTLLRIAMVFSVGLEYFFIPEPRPVFEVVRAGDRLRFPNAPDAHPVSYFFENLDFPVTNPKLNAYFAEFEPTEATKVLRHEHAGTEFFYLISGKLELYFGGRQYVLSAGDAVYFDSSVAHGYRGTGTRPTTALVVTVPA